jgi:hypothetical protein
MDQLLKGHRECLNCSSFINGRGGKKFCNSCCRKAYNQQLDYLRCMPLNECFYIHCMDVPICNEPPLSYAREKETIKEDLPE